MPAELYDHNDTLLTTGHPWRVLSAVPRPDILELENRDLDGQFHTTQLGQGATIIDVVATLSYSAKLLLDNAKRNGAPIKVTKNGRYHRGLIRGELLYEERRPNLYRVQITILQQSEGAV